MTNASTASHGENSTHAPNGGIRRLLVVYVWLIVLLVATVIAALVPAFHAGALNIVVTMLIAITKATLVALVFMHVMQSGKLVWIFAASAMLWLVILLALTFNDYLSRSQIPKGRTFNVAAPFGDVSAEHRPAEPRG